MEKIWLSRYPQGVLKEINPDAYASIVDVFEKSVAKFGDRPAFTSFGKDLSFREMDKLTADFASFLQNEAGLEPGDRIAVQLPNLLQFPVAVFGALRAGLVLVNTNPLYTEREMLHQFRDSGAKAVVILANFAAKLEAILPQTSIKTVVVTEIGDRLGLKGKIISAVVKHVKKMVPPYRLPQAVPFNQALARGAARSRRPVAVKGSDLAFLQYTGGTTGVAKGAMLTHRNVVANMLQILEWMKPLLKEGEEVVISPLPMYHIFSLTVNCLTFMVYGGRNILIANPRDFKGFIKEIKSLQFTCFTGINTLFNALMEQPEFKEIDFSRLKVSVGGATALQRPVVERWQKLTGTPLIEGYGLTETSPLVSCNPVVGEAQIGTIGIPAPSTEVRLIDENGNEVGIGEPGELCVRGPQVMKGYWNRPEETAKVLSPDGWLRTGDVAQFGPDGFLKIVDRKKDMILVSGFNVYPNEVEEVVASHPGVREVAAIGVPDAHSGEVVKVFVVKRDASLTEEQIHEHCKKNLTNYKRPRYIEFKAELPKTPVGKILRKDLRAMESQKSA